MMATIHRDLDEVPTTEQTITSIELEGDRLAAEALEVADAGDLGQAERLATAASDAYAEAEAIRRAR